MDREAFGLIIQKPHNSLLLIVNMLTHDHFGRIHIFFTQLADNIIVFTD